MSPVWYYSKLIYKKANPTDIKSITFKLPLKILRHHHHQYWPWCSKERPPCKFRRKTTLLHPSSFAALEEHVVKYPGFNDEIKQSKEEKNLNRMKFFFCPIWVYGSVQQQTNSSTRCRYWIFSHFSLELLTYGLDFLLCFYDPLLPVISWSSSVDRSLSVRPSVWLPVEALNNCNAMEELLLHFNVTLMNVLLFYLSSAFLFSTGCCSTIKIAREFEFQ